MAIYEHRRADGEDILHNRKVSMSQMTGCAQELHCMYVRLYACVLVFL